MNKVVFAFGSGINGICPSSDLIYSLKENKDVLFILSELTAYLCLILEYSNKEEEDRRKNRYIGYDQDKDLKVIKQF